MLVTVMVSPATALVPLKLIVTLGVVSLDVDEGSDKVGAFGAVVSAASSSSPLKSSLRAAAPPTTAPIVPMGKSGVLSGKSGPIS